MARRILTARDLAVAEAKRTGNFPPKVSAIKRNLPRHNCVTQRNSPPSTREMIQQLFDNNQVKVAFKQRMAQCVRATACGRLCERLVKGLGKSQVHCVDPSNPSDQTNLYEALVDPNFECPIGKF